MGRGSRRRAGGAVVEGTAAAGEGGRRSGSTGDAYARVAIHIRPRCKKERHDNEEGLSFEGAESESQFPVTSSSSASEVFWRGPGTVPAESSPCLGIGMRWAGGGWVGFAGGGPGGVWGGPGPPNHPPPPPPPPRVPAAAGSLYLALSLYFCLFLSLSLFQASHSLVCGRRGEGVRWGWTGRAGKAGR